MIGKLATIAALLGLISADVLYMPNQSDVMMYTKINFDKQVSQQRNKGISIVHYYKSNGKYPYSNH